MNTKDKLNQYETLQEAKLYREMVELNALKYELLAHTAKVRFDKVFHNKR